MTKILKIMKDEKFKYKYSGVIMAYLFLVLFMIFIGIFDASFFTGRNLSNVIYTAFPLVMVSFGQTICLLTHGIDISLGMILSLCNCVCIVLMKPDEPMGWLTGVVAALVTGMICGLINGILIGWFRLAALIVTLSMATVYGGIALYLLPMPGGTVHKGFAKFLRGKLGGIPVVFFLLLIVLVIVRVLLNDTPLGRKIRAVGGNYAAAYATGIDTVKTKIIAHVLAGLLSAVGGIFLAAYMYSGDPTIGSSYSLRAIASSIIGGAVFSGAVGDVLGTLAGVIILTLINNMLNLLGISSYFQFLLQGIIIIAALALGSLKNMSR